MIPPQPDACRCSVVCVALDENVCLGRYALLQLQQTGCAAVLFPPGDRYCSCGCSGYEQTPSTRANVFIIRFYPEDDTLSVYTRYGQVFVARETHDGHRQFRYWFSRTWSLLVSYKLIRYWFSYNFGRYWF